MSAHLFRQIGNTLIIQDNNKKEVKIETTIYYPGLVCQDSTLYIVGGQTSTTLSPEIYSISLASLSPLPKFPDSFQLLGNLTFSRFHHTVTYYNNTLYILGGNDNHSISNFCEKFEIPSQSSIIIPPMPVPCMLHSSALNNGKIYVAGGINNQNKYNETLYILDLSCEKWSSILVKLISACKPTIVPLCQKTIAVFGGWIKDCKFNNKVVAIDTENYKNKVLKHFNIGEFFQSFTVKNGILSLMDHTGMVHMKSFELIKKSAKFKLWQREIWRRRKGFVYFLAYYKGEKLNLPENILKEICRFL